MLQLCKKDQSPNKMTHFMLQPSSPPEKPSPLTSLVLFIFLGIRQAIVSSFTIPLTFSITFVIMTLTGITLNFISLFAMLLSLGLLVDDAIVVISAISS